MSPRILLRSEESGGAVSVVEFTAPPRWDGPFLHTHDFDEAWYLLEGELVFQVGDEVVTKRAGDFAFAPRGVPHTLANHSDAPATLRARDHARGLRALLRADGRRAARVGVQPIPEVTRVGPQIAWGG